MMLNELTCTATMGIFLLVNQYILNKAETCTTSGRSATTSKKKHPKYTLVFLRCDLMTALSSLRS